MLLRISYFWSSFKVCSLLQSFFVCLFFCCVFPDSFPARGQIIRTGHSAPCSPAYQWDRCVSQQLCDGKQRQWWITRFGSRFSGWESKLCSSRVFKKELKVLFIVANPEEVFYQSHLLRNVFQPLSAQDEPTWTVLSWTLIQAQRLVFIWTINKGLNSALLVHHVFSLSLSPPPAPPIQMNHPHARNHLP